MTTPPSTRRGRLGARVVPVVAVTASLALGLGVAIGVGLRPDPADRTDGRSDGRTDGPTDSRDLRLVGADLTPAASCAELLSSLVDRGLEQVGPWGWGGQPFDGDAVPMPREAAGDLAAQSEAGSEASSESRATAPSTVRSESGESGTNVQEVGVDEADIVKTEAGLLVRLDDGVLRVVDVAGTEPVEVATLTLRDLADDAELLLDGGIVTVVGGDTRGQWLRERIGSSPAPRTRILTVDLADPSSPGITDERVIDGAVLAVRLHGDIVRVVTQTGLPDLDFEVPPVEWFDAPTKQAYEEALEATLRANQDVVRSSTLEDWLPTITVGDGEAAPLVDCEDVAIPADTDAALGIVAITGFQAGSAPEPATTGVATGAATVYTSADRLYLAQDQAGLCCMPIEPSTTLAVPPGGLLPAADGTTALHAFSLEDTSAGYLASGEVEGSVRDRWSMDESDGLLRVAVGRTVATGNHNSVLTLREDGTDLVEVGRLDGLGVDEDIKAVRWFDDLAVVVTFRQVDPLYAVDLTDPAAPRALGELKIPGFSEYLHPLGSMRMIGVGQDATSAGVLRGAQAALFDVSDLTSPRRLDTVSYPRQSYAGAALDPRQFTWLPDRRIALTVVSQGWTGRTGWVSVLRVGDGALEGELVEVEHGDDVDRVRTVPLADGRVALVTGDDVEFFDV